MFNQSNPQLSIKRHFVGPYRFQCVYWDNSPFLGCRWRGFEDTIDPYVEYLAEKKALKVFHLVVSVSHLRAEDADQATAEKDMADSSTSDIDHFKKQLLDLLQKLRDRR